MDASVNSSRLATSLTGEIASRAATLTAFKASLSGARPSPEFDPPLAALWWAAKGGWNEAHMIVQNETSAEAAWVHAYLHRVEGDLGNAGYWYRRAAKAVATGPCEAEWEGIAAMLLERPTA
jgi:hypothetical protein